MKSDLGHAPRRQADRCPSGICCIGLARIFHIRSGRKPSSFNKLQGADVKCDFREPNVIRLATTSLHNTFQEVWRFAKILAEHR